MMAVGAILAFSLSVRMGLWRGAAEPPATARPAARDAAGPCDSPRLPPPRAGLVRTPKELEFNLLVAGLSGLGKTTACELLFHGWTAGGPSPTLDPPPSTRSIDARRSFATIDEPSNTRLTVRIIDTPGYGDGLDSRRALRPICAYARDALGRQYTRERSARGGHRHADQQVHCCLLFTSPHRLLAADRLFLRRLQAIMPVVLLIAKADTLTDAELGAQRREIRRILGAGAIRLYDFHERAAAGCDAGAREVGADGGAGEREAAAGAPMHDGLIGPRYSRGRRPADPLAVLARSATYPWGAVSADEPAHSDFPLLRQLLLSHHAERLIELARARYRLYRARRVRLEQLGRLLTSAALVALATALAGRDALALAAARAAELADGRALERARRALRAVRAVCARGPRLSSDAGAALSLAGAREAQQQPARLLPRRRWPRWRARAPRTAHRDDT